MVLSARHACLSAAAVFAGLALLIARLAVAPLGAADLLGIAACSAAAGSFATLAFALRAPEPRVAPAAAANAEPRLGLSDSRPPLTVAEIPPPPATARPSLGRGLAGLMHHPSALSSRPSSPASAEPHTP